MLRVLAEDGRCTRRLAELAGRLGKGRDRADAHVLAVEAVEPVAKRARREDETELVAERCLVVVVLTRRKLRPAEELAEAREELRLERCNREHARVARRIDRIARVSLREYR